MRVCVIGAGAAGMLTGGMIANAGIDVVIIEKNAKPGRKLYITGKGRCNVTNLCAPQQVIDNTLTNPKFLYSSIKSFTPQDTVDFFNSLGVPTKVERGGRVFPLSDKSSDIIDALKRYISNGNCSVKYECVAESILTKGNKVVKVKCSGGMIECDIAIIATGGVSYPATGSTGDGYKLAKALGHSIVTPKPALVAMNCNGVECLSGLGLKNVSASIYRFEKLIATQFGEMLFTHNGVSGPIILTLSDYINRYSNSAGVLDGKFYLKIDLKPALDIDKLKLRIIRDIEESGDKAIKNNLSKLMPKALIPHILRQSGINEDKKSRLLTNLEIGALALAVKNYNLCVTSLDDVSKGIVTSGGIDVKEANPKTCASKLIEGLYFAGEVLDIDALTGGYNLQIAFSTACAVARNVIEKALIK